MAERISTNPHTEEEFSLPLFLFVVAISFGGYLGLVWLLAPGSVWAAQIFGPFWKLLTAFSDSRSSIASWSSSSTATSCTSQWPPS
jgi:hypothetical protein